VRTDAAGFETPHDLDRVVIRGLKGVDRYLDARLHRENVVDLG
jgi:hypothetical protein